MKNEELEIEEQILNRLTVVEQKILEHNKKMDEILKELQKRKIKNKCEPN